MDVAAVIKYTIIGLVMALFLILFIISAALWYFNLWLSAQDKAHKTIEDKDE